MDTYTAKEAKNRLGEVFRAALREPVVITQHGKPAICIMSIDNSLIQRAASSNTQDVLDDIKHRISCEVLASFPIGTIKDRSRENIARWRRNGTTGLAYEEWLDIIDSDDDGKLINAMVGLNENSNRLRQSIPYVGMLHKSLVRELNEKIRSGTRTEGGSSDRR